MRRNTLGVLGTLSDRRVTFHNFNVFFLFRSLWAKPKLKYIHSLRGVVFSVFRLRPVDARKSSWAEPLSLARFCLNQIQRSTDTATAPPLTTTTTKAPTEDEDEEGEEENAIWAHQTVSHTYVASVGASTHCGRSLCTIRSEHLRNFFDQSDF